MQSGLLSMSRRTNSSLRRRLSVRSRTRCSNSAFSLRTCSSASTRRVISNATPATQAGRPFGAGHGELVDQLVTVGPIGLALRLRRLDVAFVQRPPVMFAELPGRLGREDLLVGLGQNLRQRTRPYTRGFGIAIDIAPLQVLHPCRAGQMVHEGGEALLRQPQFRPRPIAGHYVGQDFAEKPQPRNHRLGPGSFLAQRGDRYRVIHGTNQAKQRNHDGRRSAEFRIILAVDGGLGRKILQL